MSFSKEATLEQKPWHTNEFVPQKGKNPTQMKLLFNIIEPILSMLAEALWWEGLFTSCEFAQTVNCSWDQFSCPWNEEMGFDYFCIWFSSSMIKSSECKCTTEGMRVLEGRGVLKRCPSLPLWQWWKYRRLCRVESLSPSQNLIMFLKQHDKFLQFLHIQIKFSWRQP